MSISAADRLLIASYLDCDPRYLGDHIDAYTNTPGFITSTTETAIAAQLSRWADNNLDDDFTVIEGNIENLGANIDPEDLRIDIRSRLITLLFLKREAWFNSSGDSQFNVQIFRG